MNNILEQQLADQRDAAEKRLKILQELYEDSQRTIREQRSRIRDLELQNTEYRVNLHNYVNLRCQEAEAENVVLRQENDKLAYLYGTHDNFMRISRQIECKEPHHDLSLQLSGLTLHLSGDGSYSVSDTTGG